MKKHILLVEPKYYTRYPPIGLLKLATYHKNKGDTVEFIRGCDYPKKLPDKIYVTSLFTWAWKPVKEAVKYYKAWFPTTEMWLGGLYASLMPQHARQWGAEHVHQGLFKEAEDLLPDYSLVPKWNDTRKGSIIFSTRGCNRNCGFCAVPFLEGKICSAKKSIKHLIWKGHTKIIFFDNNILENPYWRELFDELHDLGMPVDFNQGIDARLITPEVAQKIKRIKLDSLLRIAYDTSNEKIFVEKAIKSLSDAGISPRRILVYALFNYNESPDQFYQRMKDILNWGSVCYPMRYEPINALNKNLYVHPKWKREQIEAIQRARRVIGYHGAFAPYDALKAKFNAEDTFDRGFWDFLIDYEEAQKIKNSMKGERS